MRSATCMPSCLRGWRRGRDNARFSRVVRQWTSWRSNQLSLPVAELRNVASRSYPRRHRCASACSSWVIGDLQCYLQCGSVVLVTEQCSVTIGVPLGVGNIMRKVIICSLTATAVVGGLFFGSTGVAAANPAPTASRTLAQPAPPPPMCTLGTFREPTSGLCMAF